MWFSVKTFSFIIKSGQIFIDKKITDTLDEYTINLIQNSKSSQAGESHNMIAPRFNHVRQFMLFKLKTSAVVNSKNFQQTYNNLFSFISAKLNYARY